MGASTLRDKLIDYLQDAHAMEQNVVRMLDSMILSTTDPETRARLQEHRQETERHEQLVRVRLQELGASRSIAADLTAVGGGMLKAVVDQFRSDKPGKNARDGYITEHTEIAAYQLLERLANRAGDRETARIAREIRYDEEEMAHWIATRWDKFIDLVLREAGIEPVETPI